MPSSFPDGLGSALQSDDGSFERVNIDVRNVGSDAAPSLIADNLFEDCRIFASGGGTLDSGFRTNGAGGPGTLRIVDTRIEDASTGVRAGDSEITVRIQGSRISNPSAYGAVVADGAGLTVVNSIIESGSQNGIYVNTANNPGETDAFVTVRSSTLAPGGDPGQVPIGVSIGGMIGSHSATVLVTESILRGFNNTWELGVPIGPGLGNASLTLRDSNFEPGGLPADSPHVDFSDPRNIDADPLFAGPGNYRLLPGSPSIDAGTNAAGGPGIDFAGAPRPRDGNGDGIAVRDQGAFERRDTFGPKITRLRAKKLRRGGVRIRYRLSEAARVRFSFKPVPARSLGNRRKSPKLRKKARRGLNTLVVRSGRLSAGRYGVRITAVDRSGNRTVARLALVKAKGAANFNP